MSDPFIAEIKMFGGDFAPRGWAFCDGQILPISQNTALFSLLGTTYGGDGRTTFGLPDLRGRVPMHVGSSPGPGLSNHQLGEKRGRETVTLTEAQIPSHSHAINSSGGSSDGSSTADLNVFNGNADTTDPAQAKSIASGISAGLSSTPILSTSSNNTVITAAVSNIKSGGVPTATENTGSNTSISNVQPYTAIQFIIALQGVFPSRS